MQAENSAGYPGSLLAGRPIDAEHTSPTIADGIAVKRPGEITVRFLPALPPGLVLGQTAVALGADLAVGLALVDRLDLDDLGTVVAQHLAAIGSAQNARQVDDFQSFQCPRHLAVLPRICRTAG